MMMKKWMPCFAAVLAAMFLAGCATENNYREGADFYSFLVENNVTVTQSQPLNPAPFRASSGMAFEVTGIEDGKEVPVDVAVYKFNMDNHSFASLHVHHISVHSFLSGGTCPVRRSLPGPPKVASDHLNEESPMKLN